MKKNLLVVLVVLSMLMMVTGAASAAPSAGSALTLVSATAGMNGTVFIFKVNGEFSRSELHGSAHVENGGDYSLDCAQVDAETVRCTASLKVQGNVVVTFGGSTFWTYIKLVTKYCYPIYDWNFPSPFVVEWVNFATHCQSQPAEYGDFIFDVYNPDWDESYDYQFMPNSPSCPFYQPGDAYYYPYCPI